MSCVTTGNLMKSAIYFIYAQYDLNLASMETNRIPGSWPSVPGISLHKTAAKEQATTTKKK